MTVLAVELRAIAIGKLDIVVVKDLTMVFSFAYLAATHALCFYRMPFLEPVYHIYVVNVLLTNMIAAQPYKIVPVAHLVFHFGLCILAFTYPHAIVIPP